MFIPRFVYFFLLLVVCVFFFFLFISVFRKALGGASVKMFRRRMKKKNTREKSTKKQMNSVVTNQSRCKAYLLSKWLSKNKYLCRTLFLLYYFIFIFIFFSFAINEKSETCRWAEEEKEQQSTVLTDTQISFN